MALSRFVLPFADVGGGIRPSSGAKLFFYATGTSTPANTFSDFAGTTPNTNPVIADSKGIFPNIFLSGIFNVVLKDSNDVQIWSADPVTSVLSLAEVETIVKLRSVEPTFDGQQISLLGHTLAGAGGGTFYYDASDAISADNNGVVIVTTGGKRWKRKESEAINICDFGALPLTDSKIAVQAAEDYCSSIGGTLTSNSGTFYLTSSVLKKANSDWKLSGQITYDPSVTTAFALVYAVDVNNWSIDSSSFQAARHETITVTSSAAENLNSCISVERCNDWTIDKCKLNKYGVGIFYSECNNFSITNNKCFGDTGKNVLTYETGTFTPFSSNSGTGDIVSDQQLGVVTPPSENFVISNNTCISIGLDIGINVCTQAYKRTPGIVNSNVVMGQYAGIQVYKGTLTDPGTTETYQRNIIITNNLVTFTYQQGIYIRLTFGCLLQGNIVRKANMNGVTSETGAPYGGIVTRVSISAQGGGVVSDVGNDVGNLITGNMVLDTGRSSIGAMAGIQVRTESTVVTNNFVAQSEELYGSTPTVGLGIYVADDVVNFDVSRNTVQNFFVGVEVARSAWSTDKRSRVTVNKISNILIGINLNTFMPLNVTDNKIDNFTSGIIVRKTAYVTISNNILSNGTDGIKLSSGNYHSDIDSRSALRIGQTTIIKDNIYQDVATPHAIAETSGIDAFFFSRCAVFRNEIIDGMPYEYGRAGGTPFAGSNQKSWNKSDTLINTTPSSFADSTKVCTSPGTYGTLSAVTGSITSGSPTLTVNNSDGLAPNVYITIVGVSGVKRIVSVAALVITLDSNANATVSSAVVAYAVPSFA